MTAATDSNPQGNPMQTPISCAIPALEPFDDAVGHARLADELGYDSIMLFTSRLVTRSRWPRLWQCAPSG
jgi:hypothetical protein